MMAVLVAFAVMAALWLGRAGRGGESAYTAPRVCDQRAAGPVEGCPIAYTARPGDTLWSIALRYSGGGDPRALVGPLEAELRGGVLQPGERLIVP